MDTDGTFEYSQESRTWNWTGVDTGQLRPWDHSWIGDLGSNRPIAGIKDWYFLTGWVDESTTQVSYNNTSAVAYNHRIFNCPSSYDYAWDGRTPKAVSGKKWKGNVRVYDSGDPENHTAKTENPIKIELIIAETLAQYTDYMSEKVQKRLDKKDITFTKIFDIPFDEAIDGDGKYHKNKDITFKEALKEYGLDSLESFWKSYDGCMDVLRNNGVTDPTSSFMPFNLYYPLYEPYYGRQQLIEEEMAIREATVNALKAEYEGYRAEMDKINEDLNLEKYLGTNLLNIFWAYTREDTYQNQNYVSTELSEREISDRTQELIKKATEELQKACKLQITLQDSVKNLLNTEEFKNYKDKFNIGDYIVVEVDDEWYRLRLITASFSYSSPDNISFTFSNATRLTNYFADAQSVIDSAKTISGSYNAVVHQVEQSATVTEEVTDWVDNGLSSALANIMNNDHEEILIDENGLTAKEWDETTREYGKEQFRITHNSIQFTEDDWQTAALGIGKNTYIWYNSDPNDLEHPLGWNTSEGYGVNAKFVTAGYINGSQFIGGEIYSDNYQIEDPTQGVDADGSYINLRNGNFTLGGGGLVGTRNDDGTYTLSYKGDYTGHIDVDVGSRLGTWTVYADGLYSGSSVLKPDNIYVTGNVRASDFIVGTGSGSYNLSTKIADLTTNKQDVLTAGTNITIEKVGDDTVISATGGSGLQYWTETETSFYREGTHEGIGGLEDYLKPSNNEVGNWQNGNGWFRCMVTRLKGNVRNVIMGYSINTVDRHPIITCASTEPLDFEWGWSDNTFYPPYNVATWADKDTYPIPREGYDWYFGWDTGTVTYEGETWYILLIDTYTWSGGTAITSVDGIASFVHSWEDNPQSLGLTLLQTAHAVPYTTAITEIGTEDYVFKYGSSDKTYASIDTNGNAVFKELTTDAGSLTSQLATKQDALMAGANVSIDNNVISATDTTYSDFSGSTHGLVPAVQTQAGKFLKDDGTWETIQTGTEVEANPSDTATSTLLKLKVDDTVYSISGGGGGGSFVGLTKAEYDALPTVDKEDTSKLYLVQEGGELPTDEDLILTDTDWQKTTEGSMSITWTNNTIVFHWIGGSSIGANIVKKVAIPANASKIKFKMTTGSRAYSTTTDRFRVFIGVRTTYQTGIILPYYSINDWLVKDDFNTLDSVWEDELDLSGVNVDTYLYVTAHGWDVTINELEVEIPSSTTIVRHTYWNNSKWSQWNQVKELTQGEYNALTTAEKQDGSIYMTHDGGYDFINYDNGKIIVRVNTTTGETIWFFNGYTKEAADIDVPTELVPYIPTQTYSGSVLMCWAWTDDTSTTRNGAVGFVYPGTANVKLRSWNNSYASLMGGTFWGTLIIDGAQEQQTNYSAPTEGLTLLPNRIYYNDTMYAEKVQSGSSGVVYTNLYTASNETAPNTITLNDDITNYDMIVINISPATASISTLAMTSSNYIVDALVSGCIIGAFAGSNHAWYNYTNSTTLTKYATAGNYYIKSIVGIKY